MRPPCPRRRVDRKADVPAPGLPGRDRRLIPVGGQYVLDRAGSCSSSTVTATTRCTRTRSIGRACGLRFRCALFGPSSVSGLSHADGLGLSQVWFPRVRDPGVIRRSGTNGPMPDHGRFPAVDRRVGGIRTPRSGVGRGAARRSAGREHRAERAVAMEGEVAGGFGDVAAAAEDDRALSTGACAARARQASSAKWTSRARWFGFSTAQWPRFQASSCSGPPRVPLEPR